MNLVELKSVGSVIDVDDSIVFPMMENGEADFTMGVTTNEVTDEWMNSLSVRDTEKINMNRLLTYNKLIAEFMGWDILSPTTIPPNLHLSNLEVDNGEIANLKFHSSWDWLMPVVDKCFDTHFEHSDDLSFLLKTFKPLEEVYKAVVEFIKRTKKGA